MDQWQYGMELNWKTAIWRGHEQRLSCDAPQFFKKLDLVRPTADVLEDGARMNVVE